MYDVCGSSVIKQKEQIKILYVQECCKATPDINKNEFGLKIERRPGRWECIISVQNWKSGRGWF